MRRRRILAGAVAGVLGGTALVGVRIDPASSAVEPGTVERVSVGAGGTEREFGGEDVSVSGDGNRIAFVSQDGSSGPFHVYVRDRDDDTTVLVSRSTEGCSGPGDSYDPSISADGRFVAFTSESPLVSVTSSTDCTTWSDGNNAPDVYVHDLQTGTTEMVSVPHPDWNDVDTPDDSTTGEASISADGRYVAFSSDNPYVHNDIDNHDADGQCLEPDAPPPSELRISDNSGVEVDSGQTSEIPFIIERSGSTATQATVNYATQSVTAVANDYQSEAGTVTFLPGSPSASLNITIFGDVTDENDETFFVNLNSPTGGATIADGQAIGTIIDDDGFVQPKSAPGSKAAPGEFGIAAVGSTAINCTTQVFVRDRTAGTTLRVSERRDGALVTPGDDDSGDPSIAPDGGFVAYTSEATTLSDEDTDPGQDDVYLRDVLDAGGALRSGPESHTLVSRSTDGREDGPGEAGDPSTGSGGTVVAFTSTDDLLDPPATDDNGVADVYVYDATGSDPEVTLVSRRDDGSLSDGPSTSPSISSDGRFVAFDSVADLVEEDDVTTVCGSGGDGCIEDVYLYDRQADRTTLVSAASDETVVTGDSDEPSISGNGLAIAFESTSPELVDDDENDYIDAFVRDRSMTAAPAPGFAAAPNPLDLGQVAAGATGPPQTITVTNTGNAALQVTNVQLNDAPWATLDPGTCVGAPVAAGGTCQVQVRFSPTTAGPVSGSVVFTTNASGSPHQVALQGNGAANGGAPAISVSPDPLDAGDVLLGSTSPLRTVTVSSVGTADLSLGAITIGGGFPGDWLLEQNSCPSSLPPGSSCALGLRFVPGAAGPRDAVLRIDHGAPGGFEEVPLQGRGATQTVPGDPDPGDPTEPVDPSFPGDPGRPGRPDGNGSGVEVLADTLTPAAPGPTLILNPAIGPPGTTTSATGAGFPPNTTLQLRWSKGLIPIDSVTTDASGGFQLTILLFHRTLLGDRILTAAAPGGAEASDVFLVVPATVDGGGGLSQAGFVLRK